MRWIPLTLGIALGLLHVALVVNEYGWLAVVMNVILGRFAPEQFDASTQEDLA